MGGVVAIFLVEFSRRIPGAPDDRLWVLAGDLPCAYLVVELDDSPADALQSYCGLMQDWISAVRAGGDFTEVFPVSAARTLEHADQLESRLVFLRAEIIPHMTLQAG